MKKIFYTFLLISPLLFISSCDKSEEEQVSPLNNVYYDGNYIDMGGPSILIFADEEEGVKEYSLRLTSSGITTFMSDESFYIGPTDSTTTEYSLYFNIRVDTIINGTYNVVNYLGNSISSGYAEGGIYFCTNMQGFYCDGDGTEIDLKSGNITIDLNNDNPTFLANEGDVTIEEGTIIIDVTAVTEYDTELTAHYEGVVIMAGVN